MKIHGIRALVSETFKEWMNDNVSQLAAGLAFYTLFSLSPILLILLALLGALYGEETARMQIIEESRLSLGPRMTEMIEMTLENVHTNSGDATVLGIVGMLFGSTIVFVNLQHALNAIWAVAPKPGLRIMPLLRKRVLSFLMVLGFGLIALFSVITSTAVAAFVQFANNRLPSVGRYLTVLDFVFWFAILTFSFAIIYKFLPDVRIRWVDVLIGSVVAGVLFTIGRTLIAIYLAHSTTASAFGAAGSVVVLLLWVYYSAQIFLLCGEFTQVYSRRYGKGIIPDQNSVRVLKTHREVC